MQRLASVPLGYQPGTGWEYSQSTRCVPFAVPSQKCHGAV
jgi:hypothetical protein